MGNINHRIQPSHRAASVNEYYFARKLREVRSMGSRGADIINLGIGNPDLQPPGVAVEALVSSSHADGVHGYQPYKGLPELRESISDWYRKIYGVGLDPESEVLPLIGSKEGVFHTAMAFLDPGDKALVPDPGYPGYATAIKIAGGNPVFYSLEESQNWHPDIASLDNMTDDRTKVMWLNYPNMPTGAPPDIKMLTPVVEFARRHGILLCHDNPYSVVQTDTPFSIFSIEGARECAIELNSLSKAFNMAGWRVGMATGAAQFLDALLRIKTNVDSGMYYGIQRAAQAALNLDNQWYQDINRVYSERRKIVYKLLDELGCTYTEHQAGMFVWARVRDEVVDVEAWLDDILLRAHVFMAPGSIFGSNGVRYIRVSLCASDDRINEALLRISQLDNL